MARGIKIVFRRPISQCRADPGADFMKKLTILAALAIAGATSVATAQAPGAPAAKPQAPSTATPPRKIPGVSDEGNAILQKAQSTPDPLVQQLGAKARAAHDQLMSAV